MNATKFGISDLLLLTASVAILGSLYFSNDLVALSLTAALLFMLQHYARRFATIRQSGLYFALGALAGYIFCEIYFQVPFFFVSPRLGLICFCMTLGGTLGIGLRVANARGVAK